MSNRIAAVALATLLTSAPVWAEDAHHPPEAGAATQQAQPQPVPGTGAGGMMMGGQGGMMNCPMMGRGGMMGMMGGSGMSDMADMAGHIDGHVAFLKAELKITAAQEKEWAAFADALRAIAATMPQMSGMAASTPAPLAQLFDQKERLLATRLENFKRLHTTWANLEAALTPEQRQSAQQLLGPRLMMF